MRIARIAEDAGVAALAVHGRTRDMLYTGEAEYETIAAIKQAVRIPVIANGDVTSPQKARDVLAATGADALMIGRAAQGRPWIFREVAHFLATGELLPPPSIAAVRDTLLEHVRALHEFYGETAGVRIARKHLGLVCEGSTRERRVSRRRQSRRDGRGAAALDARLFRRARGRRRRAARSAPRRSAAAVESSRW